jgi:hypothetical protein
MARLPRLSDLASFDFSQLDFSQLDLSKLDLPKLDLAGVPTIDTDQVVGVLRDAAYVAVGFGVLTVQQAQVRRRELMQRLRTSPVVQQLGATPAQIDDLMASFETRVAQLDERLQGIEGKLDAAVEALEARLPEQAGTLVGQAHDVAKAARTQLRGLVRNAA